MARIETGPRYRVVIIESERGWGSKVDETIDFDNEPEAVEYSNNYNKTHNPDMGKGGFVPDWYMVARYEGRV